MKKLLLLFVASLTMLFVGCTQFDDSRIWDAIDELEDLYDNLDERLEELEEECEKMNTNIEALQTLVAALQANDTITSIAPIKQGDEVIGYTITFSQSEPITIYHGNDGEDGEDGKDGAAGTDGKDGYTPTIGVAKDSDENYYWTLDGEWLLDESGNKIKANGTDGADGEDGADGNNGANGNDGNDGKDGITPQLEIRDGYWYISYDNGTTWKELGKATGKDGEDGEDGADGADGTNGTNGDSFFQSVTWDEEYAYFTLSDGTVITIPLSDGAVTKTVEITAVALFGGEDHGMLGFCLSDVGFNLEETSDGGVFLPNSRNYILTLTVDIDDYSVVPQGTFTSEAGDFETRDGCFYMFMGEEEEDSSNIIEAVVVVSEGKIEATFTLANGEVHHVVYEGSLKLYEEGEEEEDTTTPPANEIWYTSSDGAVVTPCATDVFGANIVSNTYENGQGVIVFDGDVTSIGEWAFAYCSSLASVTIPDSVTSIGNCAFSCCGSLASVSIGNGVTSIIQSAFERCPSLAEFNGKFASSDGRCLIIDGVLNSFAPAGLTEYTIPESVTEIGYYAFYYCGSLASVIIPDSVTSIGNCAFFNCGSLASVTIPDSVTSIGERAFRSCYSLASVTIGSGVTSIGVYAFQGCSNLASVTIEEGVTSIGYCAFRDCFRLASVTIPDSVTEIGYGAFQFCSSLASVSIGNGVTLIGESAFDRCSSLASVYCKPTTPPTGGDYMFNNNASGRKIYVPAESVEAYKAASYWSDYADYIEGYDF